MLEVLLRKPRLVAAPLLLFAVVLSTKAAAEVQIAGDPKAMDVEAKDASLQEFLAALHDKFGLSFETTEPLDKAVTGKFHGSLEAVVSSVLFLKGYSYLYQGSEGRPILRIIKAEQGVVSGPTAPKELSGPALAPPGAQKPVPSPKAKSPPQPAPVPGD